MEKNVTLSLSEHLLREAKLIAVKHNLSLSRWLSDLIRQTVTQESAFSSAKKRALKRLRTGFKLGGSSFTRDELHER